MMRPLSLPEPRRQAFAALIRGARESLGMNYRQAADAACVVLDDPDGPSWRFVQHLETGPPSPLANPVWLGALLESLGLGWYEALNALGIGDAVYPEKCPRHPEADGPLVGRSYYREEDSVLRLRYVVQCPACSMRSNPGATRDAAILLWNDLVRLVETAAVAVPDDYGNPT